MHESSTGEDAEEELDVGGPITTSEETSGLTIDVDQQIEENKPTWMPGPSTGEYVEEMDEKEMLKELFEDQHEVSKDTKVGLEANKDPDQQDKAGDLKHLKTLKTQPVTIAPWPRHISSYHGEIEGSEDTLARPNSPTYQPPPGRSVLVSTIPWIGVIPNEDTTGISHMIAKEKSQPEIKVTSEDDAVTTPWIETIPSRDIVKYEAISDDEVAEAIDMNVEEEGERKAGEIGEQDEDNEVKTAKVRDTYVAIRKLRLQGWKLREKALKQKQRKRKKRTKWIFEADREDKDWKPPRSKRKKLKAPPRIKLVRRRPISDDEEEVEQSYRQPLQRRAWAGATLRTQSEVITFYKSLQKLRMKEGKRIQRKRRKEEERGIRGEVVTTAAPVSEVVRETPSSDRQHCLRDSGSSELAAKETAGGRSDGREQWESLEVDPETTENQEQENCHMEGPDQVKGDFVVNLGDTVGQNLEEKSRTEQSPSGKKEDGHGGETVAKEEDVQGGGADSPRGWPRAEGPPGRSRRTAEEGETAEKTEKIEFTRSPPAVASAEARQDAVSSPLTSSAQIVGMRSLLQRWASGGTGGLDCEVRPRSAEEQPSQPDQGVSRGWSMR